MMMRMGMTGPGRFIVNVYNRAVRECLKDNREHPDFDDRWADPQKLVVEADTEQTAAHQIERQYPKSKGFVISGIFRASQS